MAAISGARESNEGAGAPDVSTLFEEISIESDGGSADADVEDALDVLEDEFSSPSTTRRHSSADPKLTKVFSRSAPPRAGGDGAEEMVDFFAMLDKDAACSPDQYVQLKKPQTSGTPLTPTQDILVETDANGHQPSSRDLELCGDEDLVLPRTEPGQPASTSLWKRSTSRETARLGGSDDSDSYELDRMFEQCETLEEKNYAFAREMSGMRSLIRAQNVKLEAKSRLVHSLKHEVLSLQNELVQAVATPPASRRSISKLVGHSHGQGSRLAQNSGPASGDTSTTKQSNEPEANKHKTSSLNSKQAPGVDSASLPAQLSLRSFSSSSSAEGNHAMLKNQRRRSEFVRSYLKRKEAKSCSGADGQAAGGAAGTVKVSGDSGGTAVLPGVVYQTRRDSQNLKQERLKPGFDRALSETATMAHRRNAKKSRMTVRALRTKVAELETQLVGHHELEKTHADLEAMVVKVKLDYATKCEEYEELEMQLVAAAAEHQNLTADLNQSLTDKVKMQNQIDRLQDQLDKLARDFHLLQQHHIHLQNHIKPHAASSSSASVSSTTSNTGWRKFSTFAASPKNVRRHAASMFSSPPSRKIDPAMSPSSKQKSYSVSALASKLRTPKAGLKKLSLNTEFPIASPTLSPRASPRGQDSVDATAVVANGQKPNGIKVDPESVALIDHVLLSPIPTSAGIHSPDIAEDVGSILDGSFMSAASSTPSEADPGEASGGALSHVESASRFSQLQSWLGARPHGHDSPGNTANSDLIAL